jgi:hypothetical protein
VNHGKKTGLRAGLFVLERKEQSMLCGCTAQDAVCPVGQALFAAYIGAGRDLHVAGGNTREQAWDRYHMARINYQDHLHGWRQGDARVRIEDESWLVERHELEGWVLSFAMSVPAFLQATLKEQGLWRYAQLEPGLPRDPLTGYYHQRAYRLERIMPSTSATSFSATSLQAHRYRSLCYLQEVHPLLTVALRREHDVKRRIALLVRCLRPREGGRLTPLARLQLQRRVLGVLGTLAAQGLIESDRVELVTLIAWLDEL